MHLLFTGLVSWPASVLPPLATHMHGWIAVAGARMNTRSEAGLRKCNLPVGLGSGSGGLWSKSLKTGASVLEASECICCPLGWSGGRPQC